jgi:YHS domain-containing protein
MMRFILFLLLAYCGYLLWRYLKKKVLLPEHDRGQASKQEPAKVAELVQDPQCGVYIVKDKAVKDKIDGKDVYFCSETCRSRYIERKKEDSEK